METKIIGMFYVLFVITICLIFFKIREAQTNIEEKIEEVRLEIKNNK